MVAATVAPAAAYNAPGPRWPGKTIRYYDTLPRSFGWSVKAAAKAWNKSGAKVRFKEVTKRGRAQVVVGFGDTHGSAGYASIGKQSGAYVHLVRQKLDRDQYANMGRLIAHEFGHVLGLDHVPPGGCKLMDAAWPTDCRVPRESWQYHCRWLARDDIRGAVRLYGGKVRLSKLFCAREAAPPQLLDVAFTGGTPVGTPLEITWREPKGVKPQSMVYVNAYEAGRCRGDSDALMLSADSVPVASGRWVDTSRVADVPGTYCYEVQVQGRYGRGAAAIRSLVTREPTPVAPPVVGQLVEYPDDYYDYSVDVLMAPDTYLRVDVSPAGQCRTSPESGSYADPLTGTTWGLSGIPLGASCLSFSAIDVRGTASPPVTREIVHAPRP